MNSVIFNSCQMQHYILGLMSQTLHYEIIEVKFSILCEEYTFWDVFFISKTEMIFVYHLKK